MPCAHVHEWPGACFEHVKSSAISASSGPPLEMDQQERLMHVESQQADACGDASLSQNSLE